MAEKQRDKKGAVHSNLNLPLRAIIAMVARDYPDVKLISTGELDTLLDDLDKSGEGVPDHGSNIILLDIRETAEFEESHLSGAELIEFSQPFSKQFDRAVEIIKEKVKERKKKSENMRVYAYCAVGWRASIFLQGLQWRLQKMKRSEGSSVDPEDMRASGDDTLCYSLLDLKVVQGSIYKWAYEHRPMVDMQGRKARLVHRCSSLWGKIFLHEEFRNKGPCPLIL